MARPKSYSDKQQRIIAYNIKALREQLYDTAGECCKEMGMALSQWSKYETLHNCPSADMLKKIAKHLKTTKENLLTPVENWEEIEPEFIASLKLDSKKTTAKKDGIQQRKSNVDPKETQHSPVSAYNRGDANSPDGVEILSTCMNRILDLSRMHRDGVITDGQMKEIAERLNDFLLLQERLSLPN